jgi:hypothetical protein
MYLSKITYIGFLIIAISVSSCEVRMPERKKMPALFGIDNSFENRSDIVDGPPFFFSETVMEGGNYFTIAIPDASSDSVAISLVRHYESMSCMLYRSLMSHGDKGLLIDLRSGINTYVRSNGTGRMDFQLIKKNEFSVPVVVLYDKESQWRISALINEANSLRDMQCSDISGNPLKKGQSDGCFEYSEPFIGSR